MNQEKIGKYVREKRKEKNLTQLELAEKIGVSDRTISKWENGICLPDFSHFEFICKELDITINELLSGEDIKKDEYLKKFEENFIKTFLYKEKMRKKKQKQKLLIGLIIIVLILYFIYKIILVEMYYQTRELTKDLKIYENDMETIKIENKDSANFIVDNNIEFKIPEEFIEITDSSKSSLIFDNCHTFSKNLTEENKFDSTLVFCRNLDSILSMYNSEYKSGFIFDFNVYKLYTKYNLEDEIDIIQYYYKNNKRNLNVLSKLNDIKINIIVNNYVNTVLPASDNFEHLSGDLRGYLIYNKDVFYAMLLVRNEIYSFTFYNQNDNGITYNDIIKFLESINTDR